LRVAPLALRVQLQDLAVREAHEALDGHAGLEAPVPESFDNGADDPPQLEHRLLGRDLLELVCDGLEDLEILLGAFTADPADQPQLETGPQASRPLRDGQRRLAGGWLNRRGLLIGLEIEQQQRAFGQQGAAAHGAQVIEQRQQHEREVPAAREHALHVARQLHHGAHQRVEGFGLVLLRCRRQQVTRDLLHFLGQQRGAEDFEQPQHTLYLVQIGDAALQKHHVFRLLDEGLERGAGLAERVVQLAADQIERL